jgi:hypothetical protein
MTKKKRKLKRKLTTRQRKFFELLCKGVPATQAALKAGYSGANPSQSAYAATKGIRSRVEEALAENGLTPEGLITKFLVPAMSANMTEFAKFEGQISDARECINWDARLRAIEIAARFGGYLAPKELTGLDGAALFPDVIDTAGMRSRRKPAEQAQG